MMSSDDRGASTMRVSFVWFCLLSILSAVGCTATVKPTFNQSEFLTAEARQPGHVVLAVSPEFRDYRAKHADPMDMKEWEFELGPAMVDAFRYALESRVEKVDVRLGDTAPAAGHLVVRPRVASFDASEPLVFKFEEYHVKLAIAVDVVDGSGKVVYTNVYESHGRKRGSVGYESGGHAAHPVAAQNAIREIVDDATADVVTILQGKAPGAASAAR